MAGIPESEDALVGRETRIVRVEHEIGGKPDRYEKEPEQAQGHVDASATGLARWRLICFGRRDHGRDSSVRKPV